jgi:UDP-glucose 4-epimerase
MNSQRTLVLGGTGFIGQSLTRLMTEQGMDFISVGSRDIDLESADAHDQVSELAKQCSSVVFLSAIAPTKTVTDLRRNALITESVCKGLAQAPTIRHLTVVSSDAVYSSRDSFVSEATLPAPDSLHGVMNLSREIACNQIGIDNVMIVRPTGVYGPGDSHNSYGPNRFARQIAADGRIQVFGEGCAIRDHVYVEDVARLVARVVSGLEIGLVLAVSGSSVSFRQLAERLASRCSPVADIEFVGAEDKPTSRYYESRKFEGWVSELEPTSLEVGIASLFPQRASE